MRYLLDTNAIIALLNDTHSTTEFVAAGVHDPFSNLLGLARQHSSRVLDQ